MEELRDGTGDQCRAKVGDNSQISMSPHSRLTDPRGKEGQEIKEAKESQSVIQDYSPSQTATIFMSPAIPTCKRPSLLCMFDC